MTQRIDHQVAVGDLALPTVALALDREIAEGELRAALPALTRGGELRVTDARLVRHKPGRRSVLEYDVEVERPGEAVEAMTLVGKIRRLRSGASSLRLLEDLRRAGFGDDAQDGIVVPEPVGTVRSLRMWLQVKVPGVPVGELLPAPAGTALARRVADAAHKLHRAGVVPRRTHTMADELAVLHGRLPHVVDSHPQWSRRVSRMLRACDRVGESVPPTFATGIHRDYYGDQVLLDGDRLWLLDFDLYCHGEPALDAGNFIAHITEQSLRELGDPDALRDREQALEDRFAELAGENTRPAVRAYAALTLARHVALSTVLPGRGALTGPLLDLSEERLAEAGA